VQPYPRLFRREKTAAIPTKETLQVAGHSHSGPSADLPGDLDISVASLRVGRVHSIRQHKEPLHSLYSQISGLMAVLSPSHRPATSE